jgi:hypothetical protein
VLGLVLLCIASFYVSCVLAFVLDELVGFGPLSDFGQGSWPRLRVVIVWWVCSRV